MKTRVADEAGRVLLLVATRRHFRGPLERGEITKGPVPDDRLLGLPRCAAAGLEAKEFSTGAEVWVFDYTARAAWSYRCSRSTVSSAGY
jgi:hypothetical protein